MRTIVNKLIFLEKNINSWVLFLTLSIFSILRIPSLTEPDWYGDEGIYQVMGMAIRQGRVLYQGIWDNKPPILYLIYAFFDGDLFYVKFASLIFGLLAVIFFFYLSSYLFKSKFSIYFSSIFFAVVFGLPIIEGNIANAENFMLAPIIFSGALILKGIENNSSKLYMWSGILLSFAFLIKIVAIFDFIAFLIFILISKFNNNLSVTYLKDYFLHAIKKRVLLREFKKELLFIGAFLIPIFLTFIIFFAQGALPDYLKAAFSQNVGYVGYGNYFLFPMGKLISKLILLSLLILIISKFRKAFNVSGVFILIWLIFSAFNALFANRPYTHYLLVLLPSFSLLLGYILDKNYLTGLINNSLLVKNFNKRFQDFVVILIFVVLTILLFNNFKLYKKTLGYYKNYLDFTIGNKDINSYQAFFDKNTPRDYAITSFIKANTKEKDNIFLWSDSGQIYALSNKLPPGRYIVSYHMTFYKNAIEEIQKEIDLKKPKYIITTKNMSLIYSFLMPYEHVFNVMGAKIYERKY